MKVLSVYVVSVIFFIGKDAQLPATPKYSKLYNWLTENDGE